MTIIDGEDNCETIRDIEDYAPESFATERLLQGPGIDNNIKTVKIHKRNKPKQDDEQDILPLEINADSQDIQVESNDLNPNSYKIYLKTWGCSHNTSDSEYMAGLLAQHGFRISSANPFDYSKADSNVWVLNSCTVKGPSEQHFKNEVEEGRRKGKKVIVSGCVPQGAPRSEYIKGLSIVGVKQIDEIVHVVEESLRGNTVRLLTFNKKNRETSISKVKNPPGANLNIPKIRRNELIEIVPISTGCLNSCTYCKTKLARGHLSSYSIDEIVSRVRNVTQNEGVKEVWLTSEDLGAWGIDLGFTIVDLLKPVVECIPNDCMLRIGMTNPPYILDHVQEIAELLNDRRVYGFIHIPVQAGSDSVLLEMKREYTRNQFEYVVNYLKENVRDLTIATDIICGFPTETEADFEETMSLVEKHKFPVLYINQFYPRPGTVAAKMPRIPTHIVKTRTKRLTELFHSYTPYNSDRIGKEYSVLITDISHDKKHLVGHNKAYEQVLVRKEGNEHLMGKKVNVKITNVTKFSMIAVLLERNNNLSYIYWFALIVSILLSLVLTYFI